MADSDNDMSEISKEDLQKEIAGILKSVSLDKTSTKKVIQKLETKFGVNLTSQRKLIDQMVMEYVNNLDSDADSTEEEPPAKVSPKKTPKKEHDDEDDDEHDDSNDSDWGYHHTGHHHHSGHLLDEYSDEGCSPLQQESTITTTGMRLPPTTGPRKAVILKRVAPATNDEDEADIFGKLTAKKLRKLPEEQRDYMMIQINQMFYDKRYKPPTQPKRKLVNKSTSMPPPIKYEARRVYRVNDFSSLLANATNVEMVPGPAIPVITSLPNPFVASTNGLTPMVLPSVVPPSVVPPSVVPPSGVPEPVVQQASTPPTPAVEIALEDIETPGYNCDIM